MLYTEILLLKVDIGSQFWRITDRLGGDVSHESSNVLQILLLKELM
jgi:hypothetical protein